MTLRSSNEESHRITLGHYHQTMRLTHTQRAPILFLTSQSQLLDWVSSDYLGSGMKGIVTLFLNLIVILIKVIHVQSFKSPGTLQGSKMKNAAVSQTR